MVTPDCPGGIMIYAEFMSSNILSYTEAVFAHWIIKNKIK